MSSNGKIVAVTGATGFIGTQLCNELLKSGAVVRALVRKPEQAATLQEAGAVIISGDLHNGEALENLVSGCTAVVHCAGSVRGSSQAAFDRTNVNGSSSLLKTLRQTSPKARLVLLSSLAAREPELSWYARSKRGAEALLQEEGADLDYCIIRPPPVYGPGDKEMLPVFQMMAKGITPLPGSAESRISLIHVSDLVTAIKEMIEAEYVPKEPLYLCDGHAEGYSWHELAHITGAVWNRKVRLLPIPAWILNGIATINLSMAQLLGYSPMLTPAKLRELRHPDWVVDNTEISRALAWQPEISLVEGLRRLDL